MTPLAYAPTAITPPIDRKYGTIDNVYLEAKEVTTEIERGVSFRCRTSHGTAPGPFLRAQVNDTIVVRFYDDASSSISHSVDSHAVTGPGGGAAVAVPSRTLVELLVRGAVPRPLRLPLRDPEHPDAHRDEDVRPGPRRASRRAPAGVR